MWHHIAPHHDIVSHHSVIAHERNISCQHIMTVLMVVGNRMTAWNRMIAYGTISLWRRVMVSCDQLYPSVNVEHETLSMFLEVHECMHMLMHRNLWFHVVAFTEPAWVPGTRDPRESLGPGIRQSPWDFSQAPLFVTNLYANRVEIDCNHVDMDFVPCASLFVSFSFSSMFVYSPRIVIPQVTNNPSPSPFSNFWMCFNASDFVFVFRCSGRLMYLLISSSDRKYKIKSQSDSSTLLRLSRSVSSSGKGRKFNVFFGVKP